MLRSTQGLLAKPRGALGYHRSPLRGSGSGGRRERVGAEIDLVYAHYGLKAEDIGIAEGTADEVACSGQTMIKEHDCVVLTKNRPDEGLETGDVGTVVHIHKGGEAFEVEFMTLTGETVAIVTLLAGELRPLNRRDLAKAPELQSAHMD